MLGNIRIFFMVLAPAHYSLLQISFCDKYRCADLWWVDL